MLQSQQGPIKLQYYGESTEFADTQSPGVGGSADLQLVLLLSAFLSLMFRNIDLQVT